MRLEVRIIPNARETRLEVIADDCIKVWLKNPPVKGKANKELIKFLRSHFKASKVEIISGHSGRKKIVIIETD
ncbi:MAG: DUF167 domain-containing protein [Candidatus Helarchaeota archaeon]